MKREYTPFPGVVCELIRTCVKEKRKAEAKRETEFEERDNAANSIEEAANDAEKQEAEAAYGRAVMQIDILGQKIKFCNTKITELVEQADEPGLPFEDAQLEFPDFKPKSKGHKDEAGETAPKVEVPDQKTFETGEGVDEQLKAAVAELNLPDTLTKVLVENKFTTVGHIAKALDSEGGLAIKGVGDVKIAEITKAVKAYRKRHRQADREVEKELQGV